MPTDKNFINTIRLQSYLDTWVKTEEEFRRSQERLIKQELELKKLRDENSTLELTLFTIADLIKDIDEGVGQTLKDMVHEMREESRNMLEGNLPVESESESDGKVSRLRFGINEKLPAWLREHGRPLTILEIKDMLDTKSGYDVNLGTIKNKIAQFIREGVMFKRPRIDKPAIYAMSEWLGEDGKLKPEHRRKREDNV